jgi:hypothetical protein
MLSVLLSPISYPDSSVLWIPVEPFAEPSPQAAKKSTADKNRVNILAVFFTKQHPFNVLI